MHSVPKFVIKRLQERPATAESHPDADLLTAFAEQSLDGRERALVMEHLAACGDCRDVVALALPATERV
ncbi:MAG: zf-HC2 domain-containing protein, partial [Candidatus Sulfotelmatobacter sp.]